MKMLTTFETHTEYHDLLLTFSAALSLKQTLCQKRSGVAKEQRMKQESTSVRHRIAAAGSSARHELTSRDDGMREALVAVID